MESSSNQKAKAEELKKTGNEFFKKKDFEKAVEFYSQAIELDPSNHIYYSNRAQAYRLLKLYGEANADYDRSLQIEPNSEFTFYRKAKALACLFKT